MRIKLGESMAFCQSPKSGNLPFVPGLEFHFSTVHFVLSMRNFMAMHPPAIDHHKRAKGKEEPMETCEWIIFWLSTRVPNTGLRRPE